MSSRRFQTLGFLLDTNVPETMGARHVDIPRKLEIWIVRAPNLTLFDMDSRALGKVGIARKPGARNRPFQ